MLINRQTIGAALLCIPAEMREFLRWRRGRHSGGCRVYYGFDRLPAPDDVAGGGIIKTQDLQRAFPNCPGDANLLYLISSALPPFTGTLARRAKAAGARLILNQNGVFYAGWYGPGWKRQNGPMRRLMAQADHVFYQSQFCKSTADRFLGTPSASWEVLYNPVDTTAFIPPIGAPGPGQFNILLAGSHGASYRVQLAVDTLAQLRRHLPEARLIVAGRCLWRPAEADALAEIRAHAADRGILDAVEFTGPYSQTQALSLMHRAHVLLHTKYNDPCPRLVVEAMACGLPVVYSATGGVPELVGEEAGIGIPGPLDYERDHPPAPEHLAAALEQVAARHSVFTQAARLRAVRHFDVQFWIERHRIIFDSMAGQAGVS